MKIEITHIELQNILGENLKTVLQKGLSPEEREVANEKAKIVLGFANQMINNSNFVLNGEKHLAQIDDLSESVIKELIGSLDYAQAD